MADRMTGAIQAGRRKLFGADEETYRAFLRAVTGKDSLRAMTGREKFAVLQQMKRDGFAMPGAANAANAAETAASPGGESNPQVGLIRHLWLTLHEGGQVQSAAWESMEKYCRRITHMPLASCGTAQLSLVIETLKKWLARVGLNSHIAATM